MTQATGLDRMHERIDTVLSSLGKIETALAVLVAEHGAVRATVEALRSAQREHHDRIESLEHDRARLSGWVAGLIAAGASGGVGLGYLGHLAGLLP